jgi:hypothetical protein
MPDSIDPKNAPKAYMLQISVPPFLPPRPQAECEALRAAFARLMQGKSLLGARTAMEITLGEILATHLWGGADLDTELTNSRRRVEIVARDIAATGGGKA